MSDLVIFVLTVEGDSHFDTTSFSVLPDGFVPAMSEELMKSLDAVVSIKGPFRSLDDASRVLGIPKNSFDRRGWDFFNRRDQL